MPRVSADQATDKWERNLKGARQSIEDGVNNVTDNPADKAREKAEDWQRAMAQSRTLQKYKDGLGRVKLGDWKEAIVTKGLSRLSSGVDAGKPKMRDFASEFFPFLEGVERKVADMPNATLDDSVARAETAIRETAKFRRSS